MGGKSSTTEQSNEPPAWAAPLFHQSAGEAQRLYNSNKGFNVYGGDRVANMGGGQKQALNNMLGMDDLAAGMNYGQGQFNDLYGQSGQNTFAEQNLQGIAAGQNLMGMSPEFQDMLASQSAEIADQVNLAAAGGGRYGSGMHTGSLADSIGDFRRDAVLQNYQNEVQRQLAANQMLDSGRFQRLGMQGQFADMQSQAGMNRFNTMLQGQNAAFGAGTAYQQQRQAEMDARRQRWSERDMQDWTRLGALQAAASGSAGPYGMMTSTQTEPFNPLGLIGSIGSMFFSDRRLKADIERVGEDPRGFGIYTFRYRNSPDAIRWRGVMADEVEAVMPEAVSDLGHYKAVNYAALGLQMERV